MADTVLGGVMEFFRNLGIFDILLPFILVFTIMFAILERTKILGTEGKDGGTRKNLNAMASFVIAFLVVASAQLVAVITQVSSQIIIVLLLVVFIIMLVGTMRTNEELGKGDWLKEGWVKVPLIALAALSTLAIFLNALKTSSGMSWLDVIWNWLGQFYTNSAVAAILLVVVLIVFMYWITKEESKGEKK
jgi:hypothetical protein